MDTDEDLSLDQMLIKGAAGLGIQLGSAQVSTFRSYLKELKEWGKRLNLYSRANDREIILKDFLDSLTIVSHCAEGATLLDLGAGAGFPGIPVKIVRPDLQVYLLEANRKKIYFLRNAIRVLGLKGIEARWTSEREGVFPGDKSFDIVVSRAFGSLKKFMEKGGHFLKPGGLLIAMKGQKGLEELNQMSLSPQGEDFQLVFREDAIVPLLGHQRFLIGLRKKRGFFTAPSGS